MFSTGEARKPTANKIKFQWSELPNILPYTYIYIYIYIYISGYSKTHS